MKNLSRYSETSTLYFDMSSPERPMRRELILSAEERTIDKDLKEKEAQLLILETNLATATRKLEEYAERNVIDHKYLEELQVQVQNLSAMLSARDQEHEELLKVWRKKASRGSTMIH